MLQVILNVLDWGMGMQEAISAPRIAATSNVIDISNRVPRSVQQALEAMGYTVKRSALSYAFSGVHGISLFDGTLDGGADPATRRHGRDTRLTRPRLFWRDACDWERFRTVCHPDGRMVVTWAQGTGDEFIAISKEGWATGCGLPSPWPDGGVAHGQ